MSPFCCYSRARHIARRGYGWVFGLLTYSYGWVFGLFDIFTETGKSFISEKARNDICLRISFGYFFVVVRE